MLIVAAFQQAQLYYLHVAVQYRFGIALYINTTSEETLSVSSRTSDLKAKIHNLKKNRIHQVTCWEVYACAL